VAYVTENDNWGPGITKVEATTPVGGGDDEAPNKQFAEIADRLLWLKTELATLERGEVTIQNRGLISGCALSKSGSAARNLNITTGRAFRNGRAEFIASEDNAASVPNNTTGSAKTVQAYLDSNGDLVVTAIGESVPADGLALADIDIPDGNTDGTDPFLAAVTITETVPRRLAWPTAMATPPTAVVAVESQEDPDFTPYTVHLELVSWVGERPQVQVTDHDDDEFTIALLGAADSVVIRYLVASYDEEE